MVIVSRKMERLLLQMREPLLPAMMRNFWGRNTAGNEVVQAMKKHTDSQHIFHLKNKGTG